MHNNIHPENHKRINGNEVYPSFLFSIYKIHFVFPPIFDSPTIPFMNYTQNSLSFSLGWTKNQPAKKITSKSMPFFCSHLPPKPPSYTHTHTYNLACFQLVQRINKLDGHSTKKKMNRKPDENIIQQQHTKKKYTKTNEKMEIFCKIKMEIKAHPFF